MTQEYNMDDVKKAVLETMKVFSENAPTAPQASAYITNLVRNNHGYERNVIEQAIIYLHDEGYLKSEKEGGINRYRLSSKGHQEFIPTKYKKTPISSTTINYQTGGIGIFGSGNNIGQVTQTTINNFTEVDKVINLINASNMEEDKKRDTILDADTLKNELAKSNPDQSMLVKVWEKIANSAKTVNNAIEIFKVLQVLYPFVKVFVPHSPELPSLNEYSNLA